MNSPTPSQTPAFTEVSRLSNFSKWLVFSVAAAMMICCAGLLVQLKKQQVLGEPGVKVGPVPLFNVDGKRIAEQSVLLPETVLNAKSKLEPISFQELEGLPRDTTFGRRSYLFPDGFETRLTAVLMKTDRSSIHQPQFCLVGQGWSIDKTEVVPIRVNRPHPYELSVMKLTTSIEVLDSQGSPVRLHGLYVYWFVAKDRLATGQFDRTWSMFKSSVEKGVLERWAYISCFAQCYPGQEEVTYNRMKDVIASSVPEFQIPSGPPLGATLLRN